MFLFHYSNNTDLIVPIATCLMLIMIAIGVMLIVRISMIWGGFKALLEEGDYTRTEKAESKRVEAVRSGSAVSLDERSLEAMRYILTAPAKKLFSFSIEGEAAARLSYAAEAFLLRQTERRFGTLEYYQQVRMK